MRKYQLVTVGLTVVLIAGGLTVTAYALILIRNHVCR